MSKRPSLWLLFFRSLLHFHKLPQAIIYMWIWGKLEKAIELKEFDRAFKVIETLDAYKVGKRGDQAIQIGLFKAYCYFCTNQGANCYAEIKKQREVITSYYDISADGQYLHAYLDYLKAGLHGSDPHNIRSIGDRVRRIDGEIDRGLLYRFPIRG